MTIFTKKNIVFGAVSLVLIGGVVFSIVLFMPSSEMNHLAEKYTTEHNKEIIAEMDGGIKNLLTEGRYKCCMLKPCSRCFANPDHHDEELVCDCLVDIMNGKHPCGECLGEILEGNGNPLISEYFATAIAEKVGEDHLLALKKIIASKYDMSVEQQL
jgi:hypothetical protein